MARYAIDAPTLLHLVIEAPPLDPAHQLVAPSFVRSEAMGLLLHEVRRGARSEQDALQLHDRMTELKMRLLGDRVSRRTAWRIALEQGWETLREAEYVAIARLQADALATVDAALADEVAPLVAVVPVEAIYA